MNEFRHVIVAGSNKCGTTSLFRYLSDHPDVRPSRNKELLFFRALPSRSREEILALYERQFIPKPRARTLLEASPQYLHAGDARARSIRDVLPDARLIFILRDPADRLVSYFKSWYGQSDRPTYGYTFEEVVDLGIACLADRRSGQPAESFAQEISMADYAKYLQEYGSVWPREQFKIMFFEHLTVQTREEVVDAARFAGIDASFYETYRFEVENRSRGHHSYFLQRTARQLNGFAEPFFIRHPQLKRFLRRMYNSVNEADVAIPIQPVALQRLRLHYAPSVRALRSWMHAQFPGQVLPNWLSVE